MHIERHTHTSTHAQLESAHKRNADNQAQEPGWERRKKGFVRDLAHTQKKNVTKKPIFTNLKKRFEHIELPAKLLDYFLRRNKSNINQSSNVYSCINIPQINFGQWPLLSFFLMIEPEQSRLNPERSESVFRDKNLSGGGDNVTNKVYYTNKKPKKKVPVTFNMLEQRDTHRQAQVCSKGHQGRSVDRPRQPSFCMIKFWHVLNPLPESIRLRPNVLVRYLAGEGKWSYPRRPQMNKQINQRTYHCHMTTAWWLSTLGCN